MQVNNTLHIIAAQKDHKTYLKKSFCKQPFKLADITEDKSGNKLSVMIRSSSPGIMDNDHYHIKIEVEQNAHLNLITQGYQRLYTMTNQASQFMEVNLENNCSLCFMPHPCVPHKASDYSSVNNIYLSTHHCLTWSEVITCGRKLSGEEFLFRRYHNVTNVYLNGKLVVKENILLQPLRNNLQTIGQLEGFTHQSTLLFINNSADIKKISVECCRMLSGIDGISFGLSKLPVNGLIFRLLGYHGEILFDCNKKLADCIRKFKTYKSGPVELAW
jgi:urease accessory protein